MYTRRSKFNPLKSNQITNKKSQNPNIALKHLLLGLPAKNLLSKKALLIILNLRLRQLI